MQFFRHTPIKRKLTLITMLTSGAALLLACLGFVVHEQVTFRRTMLIDMTVLADMFDDNVAPGLTFGDPRSIEQTLRSLDAHPRIVTAAVYNKEGSVVARYDRKGSGGTILPRAEATGTAFANQRLQAFRAIELAGEPIGTIYMASDLKELNNRFWKYCIIVSILLVVSSLAALGLSARLQRIISGPIFHLAEVADAVANGRNYSVRARKQSEDELGRLIDAFNNMLERIQAQDSALRDARDRLEERVQERTRALQLEVLERQRSEEALRETNQRFEIVTRATTDVIWDWDLQGHTIWWNENFQTVFGWTPEEVGTSIESWKSRVHPEDAPRILDSVDDVLRGDERLWAGEYRFRRRDGSYATMFDRGYIIRDEQRKPIRMIGAMQDISVRKAAEADLESAHRQLIETSRQAGMAEVATGVLHNVGNVLNSVNVSATLVTETLKKSKSSSLTRVAALLREQPDPARFFLHDPRGQQLPGYLGQLAEHLEAEKLRTLDEVDSLRRNIDHIKDIVSMQQNYANVSGVTETLNINDLVEDALRINAAALVRHDVRVVRELGVVPAIPVDKHKVLQILVNLIRNAKYACDESLRSDKHLIARVSLASSYVRVEIIDNGIGIPRDNLTRIFAHGFTTRKHGHGFGLHSSALAARDLGGSLTAQSEGEGCGATFILELPANPTPKESLCKN